MTDPIRASKVRAEKVEFLWGGRVPKGMFTVVAGMPDQGKGLFAIRVAADVSRAGGRVLYSASEDSRSLMTKPRLQAAGARLELVDLWDFQLPPQQAELHELIVERGYALVVMDPFASHLTGGIKRHSDNVRKVLGPLKKVLELTDCSVIIIEHALKRPPRSGNPLAAIGGSGSGLPAFARAAYVLGIDPEDEDRRILAMAKFNCGLAPKALSFELDVEELDRIGEMPYLITDVELAAFDTNRLFEPRRTKHGGRVGRPPDKRAAAAEWLTNYLAKHGATLAGKIQEDAKQYGMSAKTLRNAADDMQVVKHPKAGRHVKWDLSDDYKELMGLPIAKSRDELEDPSKLDVDGLLSEILGEADDDDSV